MSKQLVINIYSNYTGETTLQSHNVLNKKVLYYRGSFTMISLMSIEEANINKNSSFRSNVDLLDSCRAMGMFYI